jgi:hypothetical protein
MVPAAEDVGLAGRGDLSALRRMRDYWLEIAAGISTNALLPVADALPQAEMLAELAGGSGQAEDLVALVTAYHIRTTSFDSDRDWFEAKAKQAADADAIEDLDRWTRAVVEADERAGFYRAKTQALLSSVLDSESAEGTAMLVTALTIQADSGDERAVPMIECLFNSVTPERAVAITDEYRKIEGTMVQ